MFTKSETFNEIKFGQKKFSGLTQDADVNVFTKIK